MSARFFDVFIRAAGARFTAGTNPAAGNLLGSWDKIAVAPEKSVLKVEPVLVPVGDGTSRTEGYNITVETGEKAVAVVWYDYLRATFHNKLCDVLLFDPNQDDMAIVAFGLRATVSKIVESGESITITITMAAQKSADIAMGSAVLVRSFHPACVIEVIVSEADTKVRLAHIDVTVNVTSPPAPYISRTNLLGAAYFLCTTPESPTTTVVDAEPNKVGWEFAKEQAEVSNGSIYTIYCTGSET